MVGVNKSGYVTPKQVQQFYGPSFGAGVDKKRIFHTGGKIITNATGKLVAKYHRLVNLAKKGEWINNKKIISTLDNDIKIISSLCKSEKREHWDITSTLHFNEEIRHLVTDMKQACAELKKKGKDITQLQKDLDNLSEEVLTDEQIQIVKDAASGKDRSPQLLEDAIHAEKPSPKFIELLIKNGVPVTKIDEQTPSPLETAIAGSSPEIVDVIARAEEKIDPTATGALLFREIQLQDPKPKIVESLASPITVKVSDSAGMTPLHKAVSVPSPNLQIVQTLTKKGAPLKAKDVLGRTPLHSALQSIPGLRRVKLTKVGLTIVKHLVDLGSPLKAKDKEGKTPLDMAIELQNTNAIKTIEEAKKKEESEGATKKLLKAIHTDKPDLELIEKLADKTTVNGKGKGAPIFTAIAFSTVEVVKILIKKGADPDVTDSYGWTPLIRAIERSSPNLAMINLLAKKSDVNKPDRYGDTPLSTAVKAKNIDIIKILLTNKALDVNKSKAGVTPLHVAIENGNTEIIKILLENGAKLDLPTKEPFLHKAIETGNAEIIEFLIREGAPVNVEDWLGRSTLALALKKELPVDIIKLLLEKTHVNKRDSRGNNFLHLALEQKNTSKEVVELLIEESMSGALSAANKNKKTPLHLAVEKNPEAAKLIIKALEKKKHPNWNARDSAGHSALDLAVTADNPDLELIGMLARKETINSHKGNGETALHKAVKTKNISPEVIEVLVQKGASLTAKDKYGKTPLLNALNSNHPRFSIIKLLTTEESVKIRYYDQTPLDIARGLQPPQPAIVKHLSELTSTMTQVKARLSVWW